MMTMFFEESILHRAQKKGLAQIVIHDLHDYSLTRYGSVDDYPYGGGAGMVMCVEPLANCIEELQAQRRYDEVIYTAPDGQQLSQRLCNTLSLKQNIIILCGHYKGVDERIREHFVTMEISIGDYVLSGGELAAAVISDAIVRLIPGVLGSDESAGNDSFQDGLLEHPHYTRPEEYHGMKVPEVLLSGHHRNIENWRRRESIKRTYERRPELLLKKEVRDTLSKEDLRYLQELEVNIKL